MADCDELRRLPHFVYALEDPRTGRVRYVGCTTNVKKRLQCHLARTAVKRHSKASAWIAELISLGLAPSLRVIETCPDMESGRRAEQKWISHFSIALLLNTPKYDRPWTRERLEELRRQRDQRKAKYRGTVVARREMRRILAGTKQPSGRRVRARVIELSGKRMNMSGWAKLCGISRERMRQRLNKYPPEKAIGEYLNK